MEDPNKGFSETASKWKTLIFSYFKKQNAQGKPRKKFSKDVGAHATRTIQTRKAPQGAWPSFGTLPQSF
jgi:hypothetical protein